ncbi:hypothetical protein LG651_07895 [Tamlana sp. 62-3]|uniref:DUF4625 domain-containing protein n=1 Tax=Neotamlana sargassicola TaxID=2883125 RepID=A0A9X1L744_9FLAO|nr:hypothetical protein [Tamlana sargassicola]MCB4808174.1 hypothetical protein [Tamlana sargassicola]
MKNLKNLTLLLLVCSMLVKCDFSSNYENIEESKDNSPPIIQIESPTANKVFYTDGGTEAPDYVVINATATDDSKIVTGTVTVYNSNKESVHFYEETSSTQNNISINEVYTSFRTVQEGDYSIEIEFTDSQGNSAIETINVTCLYSPIGGDTDA